MKKLLEFDCNWHSFEEHVWFRTFTLICWGLPRSNGRSKVARSFLKQPVIELSRKFCLNRTFSGPPTFRLNFEALKWRGTFWFFRLISVTPIFTYSSHTQNWENWEVSSIKRTISNKWVKWISSAIIYWIGMLTFGIICTGTWLGFKVSLWLKTCGRLPVKRLQRLANYQKNSVLEQSLERSSEL